MNLEENEIDNLNPGSLILTVLVERNKINVSKLLEIAGKYCSPQELKKIISNWDFSGETKKLTENFDIPKFWEHKLFFEGSHKNEDSYRRAYKFHEDIIQSGYSKKISWLLD